MEMILREFGKRKWSGIIRAFQNENPTPALEFLRIEPAYSGTFGEHAQAFVDLHERAGKRFMPNRLVLIAFNRFIRNQSSDDVRSVTPDIVRHWVGALTCNARMCRRRLLILRQFFDHLFKLRIIKTSPVTWSLIDSYEKVDRTFRPFLFTEEQMRALSDEVPGCETQKWRTHERRVAGLHPLVRPTAQRGNLPSSLS